jgi:hypothetical protein
LVIDTVASLADSLRAGVGPSLGYSCFRQSPFTIEGVDSPETGPHACDQVPVDCVHSIGKSVVRELQFGSGLDESHSPQIGEMAGYCGLSKAQYADDIADAELAGGEDVQDADPDRVSETLEKAIQICDSRRAQVGPGHWTHSHCSM